MQAQGKIRDFGQNVCEEVRATGGSSGVVSRAQKGEPTMKRTKKMAKSARVPCR
jgi:hypothetical protein